MLTGAGFAEPTFHGWTGYFTSSYTQGGLITARKPGGEKDAHGVGTAGGGARDREGRTLRVAPLVYGVASDLIVLVTFVYAIGLVGDFLVPKTIDSGPRVPTAEALIVDALSLGLFAVPHGWDRPHLHEWLLNLDAAVQVARLPRISRLRTNLRKGRISRDHLIP